MSVFRSGKLELCVGGTSQIIVDKSSAESSVLLRSKLFN